MTDSATPLFYIRIRGRRSLDPLPLDQAVRLAQVDRGIVEDEHGAQIWPVVVAQKPKAGGAGA